MHYRRAQFLLGHMKVLQPFITPQAAARIRSVWSQAAPGCWTLKHDERAELVDLQRNMSRLYRA